MNSFKIISLTHKLAPLELIGKLHLDENHQQDYLGGLKIRLDLKELMFLSTCNRVEFVINCDREISPEFLSDLFYSVNSRLTAEDLNALIEDRRLKNLIQWDPSRYINIWIINNMHYEIFAQFNCGTWVRLNGGGYATMPPNGGALDGIVITAFGRLLAHEMGHYLGLYHTFEGLNCANGNCKTDGDRICDTPPDASVRTSFSCT